MSRKLARTLFHCMVRFGSRLEKRQMVLGRLVEIGAELLAITAACSRAHAMARAGSPAGRPGGDRPPGAAGVFLRPGRRPGGGVGSGGRPERTPPHELPAPAPP